MNKSKGFPDMEICLNEQELNLIRYKMDASHKIQGSILDVKLIVQFKYRCPENRVHIRTEGKKKSQILYSSQAGTGYSAQSLRISSYERTPSEALAEKREQEATPVAKYIASFMVMPLYAP